MLNKMTILNLCALKLCIKMIKKIKLGNFYRPSGMEAQYVLEASLFHEIRKVFEGNNLVVIVRDFNYSDSN